MTDNGLIQCHYLSRVELYSISDKVNMIEMHALSISIVTYV